MIGYLMNFFKYGAVDTEDFEQADQMYQNAHEGEDFIRSVVWSVFDRLEIREITQFNEFRLSQYSEKKWVGERQFTLLYEINSEGRHLIYKKSDDKCKFSFHKAYDETYTLEQQEEDEIKYRFFGISMVDLTPELHFDFFSNPNPGVSMHREVYKILEDLQKKNNIRKDMLCYEVYGTLGGNDLVIIWLANEYCDVVTMIEAMRKSKIKNSDRSIVANIYTIMGLRDCNNPDISYEKVNGKMNVRLTKKGTYSHEDFSSALKSYMDWGNEDNIPMETTLGEHDITIRLDGIELAKRIYCDKGFIHIRNDDFCNNIIQANTELSVEIDYDKIEYITYKLNSRLKRTIIPLEEKQQVYDDIEFITGNKLFKELPYLKETLWILYEDYLKNISSAFSYPWVGDLHYQFLQGINYLKELVDINEAIVSKDKKYAIIRELTGIVRQSMLHVSQANRLFFEIPSTHLRNTGSYSKVLRTYYGIVKQLLLQAYLIPKKEKQASIVPFITFDVIPKVMSSKLPQMEDSDNIIINIVLPYEALVEIPKYAKLLAHEIFHYIAPKNREERNVQIGTICISCFFSQIINKYLVYILGNEIDKDKFESVIKYLAPKIEKGCLEYVIDQYDKLTSVLKPHEKDIWDQYFDFLELYFSNQSISFATKSEIHRVLYEIIEGIIDSEIQSKSSIFDEEVKKRISRIDEEYFCEWLKEGAYKNITDINSIIKYALRESMADYFMIQVMNISTRIKDYYSLNLDYKNLLESEGGGLDYRQEFRIGIITDILFEHITDKIDDSSKMKILDENLFKELRDKAELPDDRVREIIICFAKYYEVLKQYRSIIKWYLKSLQFDNIVGKKFKKNLKKVLELFTENEEDDFTKSVQYIERFQVQGELSDLFSESGYQNETGGDIVERIKEIVGIKVVDSIMKQKDYIYVTSITELIKSMNKAINKVRDSDSYEPIWFRGHGSFKYKLLPSLYRMKDNKKGEFYNGVSLREVMEPLYKSFKVKAFGASEIFQGGNNSRIGIMASMQHYSVPTNILDWTPEALVALYFAVEKYMVFSDKERKMREEPEEDADLWILNPMRLNQAREFLVASRMENVDSIGMGSYPLPSISEDEDEYKEYIPFSKQHEKYNLPVAVYVPHINQRIKAQAGTFTMFSLESPRESNKDKNSKRFEDLVEIQKRYKMESEKIPTSVYKPFLISIRISKYCLHDIADWLRNMGITKPRIYPELSNISESLTREIRDYWEKKTL